MLKNLPKPSNKFGLDSVKSYYEKLNLFGKHFSFTQITISDILRKTNPTKAAGIDRLGGKFLKDGIPILASPLVQLCNLSISHSIYPYKCKISLLPLISKLIEKVIHDQTQRFLIENDVLYKYQSGF